MVPLIVLVFSFAVLRIVGAFGITVLDNWDLPLRIALFLMFMVTASAHWGRGRADLMKMVPESLPAHAALVSVTGILEILGAAGLLFHQTARLAAICLALMLVAMFPANARAARLGLTIMGRKVPSLPIRGAMQLLFIGALVAVEILSGQAR